MANGSFIMARTVFFLIPPLQRILHALRETIGRLMNRIDALAFDLAKQLPIEETTDHVSSPADNRGPRCAMPPAGKSGAPQDNHDVPIGV